MIKKRWDSLWISDAIANCDEKINLMKQESAIAVKEGCIAYVGPLIALKKPYETLAERIYHYPHSFITPGFIDCHTHLVYAGNRAHEFSLRNQGLSYADIAKTGGGIKATVKATRLCKEEELFKQSVKRARQLLMSGVTTLEIKSGYGLELDTEIKQLRVAAQIGKVLGIDVKKTFLGAHTIPDEYNSEKDLYVDKVCKEMIPEIAKAQLADSVDVFCEHIAFNEMQTEKIFATAKQYGLGIKCHADQLSTSSITHLANIYPVQSFDHLEYVDQKGLQKIAEAKSVAVLLPGAYYCLKEEKMPPISAMRALKVPMALASDCNPGTSPIVSLLLIMNLACTLFQMTADEALLAVTNNAAKALKLEHTIGSLTVGKKADFAIWEAKDHEELIYSLGGQPLKVLIKAGQLIYKSELS